MDKINYLLPVLSAYFLYASYKGYPSYISHLFRFQRGKILTIDRVSNFIFGTVLFVLFLNLIFK